MDALDARDGEMVLLNRTAPSAVLFYGLGPERALTIPGYYGNLLVLREDVKMMRRVVDRAHDIEPDEFVERASKMLGPGGDWPIEGLEELLRFLPRAFAHAERTGTGVFAFGFGPS